MFVSMFSNSPGPTDINWHHSPVPMSAFVLKLQVGILLAVPPVFPTHSSNSDLPHSSNC